MPELFIGGGWAEGAVPRGGGARPDDQALAFGREPGFPGPAEHREIGHVRRDPPPRPRGWFG
ncbi:hypothetical protein [Streptomyces sp. NBC_00872]|uniref:hypothetical protein n=1 Tax=Streptomyces sp. NBC_00872 TaxID=2903686 RepID=UPI00386E657B|nr:hypothetical protein OG214_01795 [Streptomyces sp. NBC_00872]